MNEKSPPSPPLRLTEAATARRDEILHNLIGEMQHVHRARRNRRRAAAVIVPVAMLALTAIWWQRSLPPVAHTPVTHTVSASRSPVAIITVINTSYIALEKYRVQASHAAEASYTISDAELLSTLAAIDRPSGLVRSGGKTWLTRDVTGARANSS